MPGGPQFAAWLARIWDAGDAAFPLDLRLPQPAVTRVLEAVRPAAIIDGSGSELALADAEPVLEGDALVVATSGTTGDPKAAVLTHTAVEASARATSSHLGVDSSRDRWLACLPLSHVGGLSVVTRAILTGTPVEIQDGFTVAGTMAAALERGATLVSLVPTTLGRLGPNGPSWFRTVVLGGQSPPEDLPGNVVATYGMTETGSGVVYDGVPLAGVEIRIDGGQILLRCPMLLRAYRDGTDPKSTGGWFPTGDAGAVDPDTGLLVVHGRLDEVVISGGEKVWPVEVEALLRLHPGVEDVAVGGVSDPEWGARVVCYVVPTAAADDLVADPSRLLAELREAVKSELAPASAPRELVLVEELPRTPIGKVRRSALSGLRGSSARLP